METSYYILIKMKVADAAMEYGRFYIGEEPEFATDLYHSLNGHLDPENQFILHMELVKGSGESHLLIERKGCTLEEVTENCRMITRDTFKFLNLEK